MRKYETHITLRKIWKINIYTLNLDLDFPPSSGVAAVDAPGDGLSTSLTGVPESSSKVSWDCHTNIPWFSSSSLSIPNTRHTINLYQPSSPLSVFKNGAFMSILIFNQLSMEIKVLIHEKKLSKKLNFFYSNSFYTAEEYFNYQIKQLNCLRFETFAVKWFDEVFSGYQPRQNI